MKKLRLLTIGLSLFAASMFASSCSSQSSPESVVNSFMDEMISLYEYATSGNSEENIAEKSIALLQYVCDNGETAEEFLSANPNLASTDLTQSITSDFNSCMPISSYSVKDSKVNDKTATVTLLIVNNDNQKFDSKFNVVKIGGKWYIENLTVKKAKKVEESSNDESDYSYNDDNDSDYESTSSSSSSSSSSDDSAEWDSVLDQYEEYMTSYVKMYKKAIAGDMDAMNEYASLLSKAEGLQSKLNDAESSLTAKQVSRLNKITQKMISAMQ